ncbi:MAG: T9SS type A sorting domain-containing protein [Bacteroidales bacterium]|jgi:hypothetical protein|nr:T9SS type A sorting domain-containing protein [Bacteroidales bacterium]
MKKLILSVLGLALSIGATAQTIVSTTPQNRKVVLEEFTGVNCQYCPDGHRRANEFAAAHPGDVSLINIHTGGYAVRYTTPWGNAIGSQTGLTGYPAATINRHVFSGTATATSDRGQWPTMGNTILAMPSFVNIAATATIDAVTRVMNVHVEVYYTGDAETASNYLNVALIQDNIIGPQVGAAQWYPAQMTPDGQYRHMHMLRHLLTGQWGEELNVPTENAIPATSFFEKDYQYTLPASISGTESQDNHMAIPVELGDLHLVAFVTKEHQEIYTGVTITPTYINLPTEITIVEQGAAAEPVLGCNDLAKPSFSIKNNCGTTITSMTINYTGAAAPKQWTGSLATFGNLTIELDEVPVTLGQNTTINITIDEVNGTTPNTPFLQTSATINKPALTDGNGTPTLLLKRDRYGSETTWKLYDINGNVLQSGGPYSDVSTAPAKPDTIVLTSVTAIGCYIFEIKDSYGDGINAGYGAGNYKIVDSDGNILVTSNGQFGAGESKDFKISNYVGLESVNGSIYQTLLYPNPAQNSTTLEVSLAAATTAQITVADMLGREVINLGDKALKAGSNNFELNTSSLNNGMYFVRIITSEGTSTKKLAIKR